MVAAQCLWPNATVVCVAPGPSLTQSDCDLVRGRARVIAINHAIKLAPWADVLYSSDRTWWEQNHARPFDGLRYSVGSRVSVANPYLMCPAIQVLQNTGKDGLEKEPTGLRTGENSGHAAVNLAVHLGASRIVLLGYNMGFVGGVDHFYGGAHGSDKRYAQFRTNFLTLLQPLQEAGVELVNCTPNSRLPWPVVDLRRLLNQEAEVAA